MGKMRPSLSEYVCKVTLPMKKDGSKGLCGDSQPLNMQTHKNAYPMPLIEDILIQLGSIEWFFVLDLQNWFYHIKMNLDDVKKMVFFTKFGLYEWLVMPFGLQNVTNIFFRTMFEIFTNWMHKILKVFVDDLNIHNAT
jgi:hypothetical protein